MNLGFVIIGALVALAGIGLVVSAVRNRGIGDSPGNHAMLIGGTMAAAFGIVLAGFAIAYDAAEPLEATP